MKKKKKNLFSTGFIKIIKTPYYIYKFIKKTSQKINEKSKQKKIQKEREKLVPVYNKINVIKKFKGDYYEWEEKVFNSDSKIGIILGARGSGKTSFGMKFLENIYSKTKKNCYAMGFKKENLPIWINPINDINEIQNDSIVLIDEGGILFNSRDSMKLANKLLSKLILISRHKNITILFISQNSSNLDINIIRQTDFLVLKKTSLLQKDFERKKIQQIYQEVQKYFKKYNSKDVTYIYSDEFKGFVSYPVPSFWNTKISKSFDI